MLWNNNAKLCREVHELREAVAELKSSQSKLKLHIILCVKATIAINAYI